MSGEKGQIEGYHPVLEALRAGRPLYKIFIAREQAPRVTAVLAAAKAAGVPVVKVEKAVLDRMATTRHHQGLVALAAPKAYTPLEDLLAAGAPSRPSLLLALDGVEDPQNLGALIRTAEAMGVGGIIIPARRAVGLTAAVERAAAGALAYMPVARVTNLVRALQELKDHGYLVIGADPAAGAPAPPPIDRPVVLVLGGEDRGLRRLVKETCEVLVSIPMYGRINSLNVAAAGAILLYLLRTGLNEVDRK